MTSDVKDSTLPENDAGASDWKNRRLCSDENCIGVIGADGRCKECGRPGDPSVVASEAHPEIRAAAVPAAPPPASDPPGAADDDWENRRLCSDENCIGVIGADGRCKECGRPYAG
jgi:hypothetical protein